MTAHRRVVVSVVAIVVTLIGLVVTGGVEPTAAAQSPGSLQRYVALGDSYASGPLIPVQRTDPIGCERSTSNYPSLVAEDLGVRGFTDVSCSGAKTEDMMVPQPVQLGSSPPQFDALTSNTDLVSVTISGDDIGFTDIAVTCAQVSVTDPFGDPCERQATVGGVDRYAQRIAAVAPKVAGVLDGIRQRSPHAIVLLVGYLRVLPPAVGCYPVFPVARGDVRYLDGLEQQLTDMLADQARHHGAVFVDSYTGSRGHDACQLPGAKWVEGIVTTSPALPVHPNATGMHAVATFMLDSLRDLDQTAASG